MAQRDLELEFQAGRDTKADKPELFRAVITDAQGNRTGTNSIWRNQNQRQVWFQAWGSGGIGWGLCDAIEPTIGLAVYVQENPFAGGQFEVIRDDPLQRAGSTNSDSYRAPTQSDFARGGRMQLWLEPEMLQPLALYPGTGLAVSVVSGDYEYFGTRKSFAGATEQSISAHQPAGPTEHRLVGFYLDSSNALQQVAGSTVATSADAPEPAWPDGAFRLGVVDLDDSQTSIDMAADIDNRKVLWTIAANVIGPNLLYHTLTHDIWQEGSTFLDAADDSYVADLWNLVHNATTPNRPDVAKQSVGASDTAEAWGRFTIKTNSTQLGIVQFLEAADTYPYRGEAVSLSLEILGSNVSNIRVAIIEWTGTADALTSDVVGTWATGNPTLATNWAYSSTPSASKTITASFVRHTFENITIGTSAKNLAIFIWTPDNESNGDYIDVRRVKFEPGAKATTFVSRLINNEIEIIQRYLEHPLNMDVIIPTSTEHISMSVPDNTIPDSTQWGQYRFKTVKRTAPTVTVYPYTTVTNTSRVSSNVGTDFGANSGDAVSITAKQFGVQNNTGGNLTTGNFLILFSFKADARL